MGTRSVRASSELPGVEHGVAAREPERRMAAYEDDGAAFYDDWCRIVRHNGGRGLARHPLAWAFLSPQEQAGWKVLAERSRYGVPRVVFAGGEDT
jgi:hypothetical protein